MTDSAIANPEEGAQAAASTALRELETSGAAPSATADQLAEAFAHESPDSLAWRQEVAARLDRYQARRKPKPPRYPSLRLRFESDVPDRAGSGLASSNPHPTVSGVTSCQALALDGLATQPEVRVQVPNASPALDEPVAARAEPTPHSPHSTGSVAGNIAPVTTAKIIEFPRSWSAPPAPLEELAEPVLDRPRILEAPEVVPPPPAMGGIIIEAEEKQPVEKRLGIDIPLQSAPLIRRLLAAALDAVTVGVACGLFAFVFWKVAAIRPPKFEMLGLALGLSVLFWAGSQYLLIVYSGATLGLRLARLELTRFDGTPAGRRLRRWRVLASFLSAVSLGMGYLWVFLDEDALCWHDRITHTYLAPKPRLTKP